MKPELAFKSHIDNAYWSCLDVFQNKKMGLPAQLTFGNGDGSRALGKHETFELLQHFLSLLFREMTELLTALC